METRRGTRIVATMMAFVMGATLMTLPASPAAANPRESTAMAPAPLASPTLAHGRLAPPTIPDLSKHPLQFEFQQFKQQPFGPKQDRYSDEPHWLSDHS